MKMHPLFAAGTLVLALAACRPGAAEYTESESPKNITVDNASASIDLRFVPRSSRLVAADAARLRGLAATGSIAPSDRVAVAAAGSPALAHARFETVAAELLHYNIVASERSLAPGRPNRAIVEAERYLVTLPPCPNWSKEATTRFTNTNASNFGCADATDLALIVANPADLASGRPFGPVEGEPEAAAVNRYLNDKVQLPAAANVGPIVAPSAQAPGPSAGAAGSPQ
jgi:pilus assembly protein CpaD